MRFYRLRRSFDLSLKADGYQGCRCCLLSLVSLLSRLRLRPFHLSHLRRRFRLSHRRRSHHHHRRPNHHQNICCRHCHHHLARNLDLSEFPGAAMHLNLN